MVSEAWYIPSEWLSESEPQPKTIVEAAQLAFRLTNSTAERRMSHTTIPLIVHQTWKNTNIETWTDTMCDCVERWLGHALEGPFAYFLWDDNGIIEFLNQYEPAFIERFTALAANVERSDIFRVLVAKHVGGIVRIPHLLSACGFRLYFHLSPSNLPFPGGQNRFLKVLKTHVL